MIPILNGRSVFLRREPSLYQVTSGSGLPVHAQETVVLSPSSGFFLVKVRSPTIAGFTGDKKGRIIAQKACTHSLQYSSFRGVSLISSYCGSLTLAAHARARVIVLGLCVCVCVCVCVRVCLSANPCPRFFSTTATGLSFKRGYVFR